MKRVGKEAIGIGLVTGANYLVPLLLFPFLVHQLSLEAFGRISVGLSIATYVAIFVDFGFNFLGPRKVALEAEAGRDIANVYASVVAVKLLLFVWAMIVMGCVAQWLPEVAALAPLLCLSAFGNVINPLWIFQGLAVAAIPNAVYTGGRLLILSLTFLLVRDAQDTDLFCWIYLVAGIAPSAIVLLFKPSLIKPQRRWDQSLRGVGALTRESSSYFLSNSITLVYSNLNTPLIGVIAGAAAAGQYALVERIVRSAVMLFGAVPQAYYPYAAIAHAGSIEGLRRIVRTVLLIGASFSAVTVVGGFALAEPLMRLMLGDANHEPAVFMLKVMLAFIPIVVPALVLAQLVLLSSGRSMQLFKLYMISSVVHLIYIYPLVRGFGGAGAIVALLSTELLSTAMITYTAWRQLRADR